jgi:protein translocase SecG subunit
MLSIAQVVVSIILIGLILIQERSSGVSGLLGGVGSGGAYQVRRGLEKFVFWITIVFAAAFAGLAILNLVL